MMPLEQAVAADREAKKNLVGCNRCFEHVPRDEANTAACSGCEATYDRDWNMGSMGDQLMKRFAALTTGAAAVEAADVPVEKPCEKPREKPCEKPCGTCGKQGHHSRQCEEYFHKLLARFQPNFAWATEMLSPKAPQILYIVQACILLKGHQQELALKAWKCINWREHLTPQKVMEAVILWNEICMVAFAIGKYNYHANLSNFLMRDGCHYWMLVVEEEMAKHPKVKQINEFNDDTTEVWGRILYAAQERFAVESRATRKIANERYACTHMARCSNCFELGHKSNYCRK